jgi:hypothetical protein
VKPAYGKVEAPRCLRQHRKRMTNKPEVVGSSVGPVPTNALVVTNSLDIGQTGICSSKNYDCQ